MTSTTTQRPKVPGPRRGAEVALDRYLRSVRRRFALRFGLAGLLLTGGATLGLVLAWLAGGLDGSLDRAGHTPLGLLLAQVVGGLAALSLGAAVVRLWRRSPRGVLRRLRRVDAPLAEDLWSALELREHAVISPAELAFRRCHTESVAERLLQVPPPSLVGFARLRQAAWLLALGVALTGVAVATLPSAAPRLLAALGAEGGPDSMPRVLRGPGVSNLRLVIHPPRYTGLSLEVVVPGTAPVSVPAGSRVTVLAKAPQPILEAGAVVPGGQVVAGTLLGERSFRVELVMRQSGPVIFAYRTARGILHVGETGPRLLLREDLAPDLSVQPADPDITLPRAQVFPLHYEITDDYGVLEARLVWKTDLGDEGALVLGRGPRFGGQRKRRVAGVLKWDLARLGLRQGQSVRFHLEARDNRTVGGTKTDHQAGSQRRRTKAQTITITGPKPAEVKVLARLRQLLEASVVLLANRLEHNPKGPCGKQLMKWKQARAAELRLAAQGAKLLSEVRAQRQVPALLRKAVTGPLARALGGLRTALGADRVRAAASARQPECAQVPALADSQQRVVTRLESWVLALDQLIGRATLERMQRLGQRIAQLQKEIAGLRAALKKNPSAELRRRITRRMKKLERLFDRLGHLWSTLQDDALDQHVNRYALDRKSSRKLLKRLSGPGQPSGADLDQLHRRVEQLKKALDRGLDSLRKYHPLPGEKGLGKDLRSVRRLARSQAEVNRQRAKHPGGAQRAQRRLARKAGQLGQSLGKHPGRGSVARLLQDAAKLMRQAADGKGQAAADKGKAAEETLDRAARSLGRQGRITRGTGEDGDQGNRTGKVAIPPAGGALPRALRQRILEGGRTAWPEGFRQPLQQYYERLLR